MPERFLSLDEFQDLLDRRGADCAAWPDDIRPRAAALLDRTPEARQALASAAALRARFADSEPKAPPGLLDRIVDKALDGD